MCADVLRIEAFSDCDTGSQINMRVFISYVGLIRIFDRYT